MLCPYAEYILISEQFSSIIELSLNAQMDSSFWFDTINFGCVKFCDFRSLLISAWSIFGTRSLEMLVNVFAIMRSRLSALCCEVQ